MDDRSIMENFEVHHDFKFTSEDKTKGTIDQVSYAVDGSERVEDASGNWIRKDVEERIAEKI